MKVNLYINKQGFKENTFRIAFKELVKFSPIGVEPHAVYLVGRCEAKDDGGAYEVPYNKKYENRYFAIPVSDKERGFFNMTTILCNNDLSDYAVINEATLNGVVKTLMKRTDEAHSTSINLEYVGSRSNEVQKIMEEISDSNFVAIINMLNDWAKGEKQNTDFRLQIEF